MVQPKVLRLASALLLALGLSCSIGCSGRGAAYPQTDSLGVGSIITPESETHKTVWNCGPKPGLVVDTDAASAHPDSSNAAKIKVEDSVRRFLRNYPDLAGAKIIVTLRGRIEGRIESAPVERVGIAYDALPERCKMTLASQRKSGVSEFRIVTKVFRGSIDVGIQLDKTTSQQRLKEILQELKRSSLRQYVWELSTSDASLRSNGGVWVLESEPFSVP